MPPPEGSGPPDDDGPCDDDDPADDDDQAPHLCTCPEGDESDDVDRKVYTKGLNDMFDNIIEDAGGARKEAGPRTHSAKFTALAKAIAPVLILASVHLCKKCLQTPSGCPSGFSHKIVVRSD
eukprot:4067114-Pyramimonas_sp.AAC.1